MPQKIHFIAELVFEKEPDWCNIEPLEILASHPEIAYRIAVVKGEEGRGSKRFIGLAELKEAKDDEMLLGRMERKKSADLVMPKDQLTAFRDPRWIGAPVDQDELMAALQETDVIAELKGLNEIEWDNLSHAYGSARDVPLHLRRLASVDQDVRRRAFQNLIMTIFHQETLYTATAPAISFLLQLASISEIPDRTEILELIYYIARACHFESLKAGENPENPAHAIYDNLYGHRESLFKLQSDENTIVSEIAGDIIDTINLKPD